MNDTMKTAREYIIETYGENWTDNYFQWDAPDVIEAMEDYAKQKLLQHGVMQAEGSDGAKGAAVGQRSVGTVAEGLEVINIKTGQFLNVEGYGFMFGKDLNTGEIKCFNIDNVSEPPSGEQP